MVIGLVAAGTPGVIVLLGVAVGLRSLPELRPHLTMRST